MLRGKRPIFIVGLLVAIAIVLYLIVPRAGGPSTPGSVVGISQLRVSNVTDSAFVASWVTSAPEAGTVMWGDSPGTMNRKASDLRGDAARALTHYVRVVGLTEKTTYYFKVVSGSGVDDNDGKGYQLTTGPSLAMPGLPFVVFGRITKPDGRSPADGVVVYARVRDANRSGTSGESQLLSALSAEDGSWALEISGRTVQIDQYFSYSERGDQVAVEADAGAAGSAQKTIDTGDNEQPIVLVLAVAP